MKKYFLYFCSILIITIILLVFAFPKESGWVFVMLALMLAFLFQNIDYQYTKTVLSQTEPMIYRCEGGGNINIFNVVQKEIYLGGRGVFETKELYYTKDENNEKYSLDFDTLNDLSVISLDNGISKHKFDILLNKGNGYGIYGLKVKKISDNFHSSSNYTADDFFKITNCLKRNKIENFSESTTFVGDYQFYNSNGTFYYKYDQYYNELNK